MKYILFITLTLAFSFTSKQASEVYICNSSGGKKFHYKKNCRGLSNCKHEIKKISIQKAKNSGKTLCGWE